LSAWRRHLHGGPWHGPSPWSADDLLGGALRSAGLTGERFRAKDFLAAVLEDGPRTTRDLWEQAQAQGFSDRTLQRARKELEVQIRRAWENGQFLSYWSLPEREPSAEDAAKDDPNSLEPWLADLRKQFPPATPLDDL
jgi:hypothetical protein